MDPCPHRARDHPIQIHTVRQNPITASRSKSTASLQLRWTEGKSAPSRIPIGALCDAVVSGDLVCFKEGGVIIICLQLYQKYMV